MIAPRREPRRRAADNAPAPQPEQPIMNAPTAVTAIEAKPGHNQPPDWAKIVTDQMARDYAHLETSVAGLLASAAKLPKMVENTADSEKVSIAVKALRDEIGRAHV